MNIVALAPALALAAAGLVAVVALDEPSAPSATVEEPAPTVVPTVTAEPTPSVGDEPTVRPSKIAVIINENRGYNQVRKGMPWLKSIGDKYGQATNMKAMTHPSQPNYVWIIAGSNRGITSNNTARVSGKSLQSTIPAAGRSFWTFGQTMSSDNCRLTQRGYYHPRHVPTTVFKDERAQCEKTTVGYDKIKPKITAGTLPNVSFIIPNNCSNSHDCSMATADKWSRTETERLMAGPDYQSGELVIVLTWDEDNKAEGNHIHTAVIHPSLDRVVVTKALNLVSLHETLAKFGGTTPLGTRYKTNPDLANAFGLSVN